MDKIWIEMHEAAEKVLGAKVISDYVTCGEVSAAVLSKSGKIYTGVCIDTCSPCGACRELMVQMMPGRYHDIEIMADYSTGRIIKLGDITPEWWID